MAVCREAGSDVPVLCILCRFRSRLFRVWSLVDHDRSHRTVPGWSVDLAPLDLKKESAASGVRDPKAARAKYSVLIIARIQKGYKYKMSTTLKDLAGERFGRLVVIERAGSDSWGAALWRCRCDCTNIRIIAGYSLRRGDSKSCGCLRDEIVSKAQSTHKKTKTRLYNVWTHMIQRCYNHSHTAYKRYGGRGITVCDE